jgi:hypothetical protein
MKIENDKYYTPLETARYCFDKTFDVIGYKNITDIIEPSGGNGVFISQWPFVTAYDIAPEHPDIIQQDFLTLNIPYKKGRLFIGNPPYGRGMLLAMKFFKKCVDLGDYISFILPISQLDNTMILYEFDLVHSEDLGKKNYSGVELHCCLNIYRRPVNGKLNNKPQVNPKDITIVRQDHKNYDELVNYDIRMVYWGSGCAGRILSPTDRKFAGEYKIIIHNDLLRDRIKGVITNYDWRKELSKIAMTRIKQYDIYRVLKKEIPEFN